MTLGIPLRPGQQHGSHSRCFPSSVSAYVILSARHLRYPPYLVLNSKSFDTRYATGPCIEVQGAKGSKRGPPNSILRFRESVREEVTCITGLWDRVVTNQTEGCKDRGSLKGKASMKAREEGMTNLRYHERSGSLREEGKGDGGKQGQYCLRLVSKHCLYSNSNGKPQVFAELLFRQFPQSFRPK